MQNEKNHKLHAVSDEQRVIDEQYMCRCIELARAGEQGAAPNPIVGAVIVAHGRIIGEGYHQRFGEAHAEVNAVRSVREEDRALLSESTVYVSLEPCAHYGKTPPCAELLARVGVKRVVVGCKDPFEKVQGRGIHLLEQAGIEVVVGVLEGACRALNRRFFTFHEHRRPYITLKWAVSRDGYLDHWRELPSEDSALQEECPARLSTPLTQMSVHHLRARHDAILVGHRTLLLDRPSLTVRHWAARDLLKVVLGRVGEGELPHGWQAYADIDTLLEGLHRQNVQSLLVEGGRATLQSFIDAGLWDEAQEELSDVCLGSGVPAPKMPIGVERRVVRRWGVPFTLWRNF